MSTRSVASSQYRSSARPAILEQLKLCPNFTVWDDKAFQVPSTADHIVDSAIREPQTIFGTETGYREGHRTLQVDAIVYNNENGELRGYEIKRGSGLHDAGKRRSILRDLLCLQALLKSYGQARGLEVATARTHIIFYYGKCSIGKPFSLVREELDEHFGWPVSSRRRGKRTLPIAAILDPDVVKLSFGGPLSASTRTSNDLRRVGIIPVKTRA